MEEIISYGISKNYLKHWGLKEALREIIQNYIDYGNYSIDIDEEDDLVYIKNSYIPEDLEFLALGNSDKREGSRGKYGEGLKMAFLIFLRENRYISISTKNKVFTPIILDTIIGETLGIKMVEMSDAFSTRGFDICIQLSKEEWEDFYSTVIKADDVLFSSSYGDIVDKPVGNIYCGGLFVSNVDNMSKSYDIRPQHLSLDRDRNIPPFFETTYYSSKINELQGEITLEDLDKEDVRHVSSIPIALKDVIEPKIVGNTLVATYKTEDDETVIINNREVTSAMKKDPFYAKVIRKIKEKLIKGLGLYDLLLEFEKNHVHSTEAKADFGLILDKLENKEK
jgi:hypothetical protein